ncbi:MAG: hypothetical protein M3A44_04030 [Gammaproteobacteria bacterium]
MSMRLGIIVVSLSLMISGCDRQENVQTDVLIYNPSVKQAWQSFNVEMAKKRPPLQFDSGKVVGDCIAYLKESRHASISEGVNNQAMAGGYLICPTLSSIQAAKPAAHVFSREKRLGKVLFDRLDVLSFPSSFNQRADAQHNTPRLLSDISWKVGQYSITSDSEDWRISIEVVAELDVNGNGIPDLLLWFLDEAKDGNYKIYRVLEILDAKREGLLKAASI